MKHIKKFNENFEENILKNNDKIQNLKELLRHTYEYAVDSVSYTDEEGYDSVSFNEYWNKYGDIIISEFLEPKKQGNIREILPQMVQISNNSRITQETAQRIVDTFTPAELNDFKRWLQLIR
jgi:hypothetical protein